ncbi:MAG: dihydropteroate synthase, partial [bacterium]|nr:dihydropteroate synthase [bacterium]
MQPADSWRLRSQTIEFADGPCLMGIVNVTPDSFSDGGRYFDRNQAVDQALQLAAAGAGILDIGGESTRPNAEPVSTAEELRRVVDVIGRLQEQTAVPISIDTTKAEVAREAIAAGAEIINDVTGLTGDAEMLALAVESGAGVCAMHMQGTPQTMQIDPRYDDVVEDIYTYLGQRQMALLAAGVQADRICLDPGIGFGKTHAHNIALMANVGRFHELGCPLLVGHSRKGFITHSLKKQIAVDQ